MLEHCWKRHSKPKLNAYLQTFFWGLAHRPNHFNIPCYLSLNMLLAIGIPLPSLKQSHQNDLKSLYYNVHEMQKIAKKAFPSFSESLEGMVMKNFLGLRPRPPDFSSAAYASGIL